MSDHGTGKAYDQNAPAFTEDDVANDFVDAIDAEVVGNIGWSASRLARYDWGGDEDDDATDWPFTVVRDDREFEVDIDVRVVELTPERKAGREADAAALRERLQAFERGRAAAQEAKP